MKEVESHEVSISQQIEEVKKEIVDTPADIAQSKVEIDNFAALLKEAYECKRDAQKLKLEKWQQEKAEICLKEIKDYK